MQDKIFLVIEERLSKGFLSSKVLLDQFRMLDESSRQSPSYHDPRYAPFYYFLGQELPAKRLLELGFGIGLASGCYARGCDSLDSLLTFQESGKTYYSPRLGIHNVKDYFRGDLDVYVGRITDEAFVAKLEASKWDLALINGEREYDTQMSYLEAAWSALAFDGVLVMDCVSHHGPTQRAYQDFCRSKGREPRVVGTRYGNGVIDK